MKKNNHYADLRSDTVTQPTKAMREAMVNAPVGDDVMGEDPSINELERYAAKLFGKQAAVFVPSGTMANQISVRAYAGPGDEILMVDKAHLFFYEAGSAAGISGVQLFPVPCDNGVFNVDDFKSSIRADDPHFPKTRLFWIENTHNKGGGKIVPIELMKALNDLSKQTKIPVHMDGARICNASVASEIPLVEWAAMVDSLSVCLSKGLGAPVGSIVLGNKSFIYHCRRARKALGGGMRQAGIIAAAGLYALKNHIKRLNEDHRRAKLLAHELTKIPGLSIHPDADTNIVMVNLEESMKFDGQRMMAELEKHHVRMFALGPRQLRAVTHLDVSDQDIIQTIEAFSSISKAGLKK